MSCDCCDQRFARLEKQVDVLTALFHMLAAKMMMESELAVLEERASKAPKH